jgi:MoxR-like ATPase
MKLTWSEIEAVVKAAKSNVLIFGPPSLGKSFLAQALGGYAVTIHDGTAADELRGHWVPQKDGFAWHDGLAIRAWREGVPFIVNEIDKGSDEVKSILHVIADNPETAKLSLPTNETLTPKVGFKVVATMNGKPEDLPDAVRSRFPIQLFVDEPHPGAIAKLPQELREIARRMATAFDDERKIPLRSWYAFVELSASVGQELALKAVFGDRSDEMLDALTLDRSKVGRVSVPAPRDDDDSDYGDRDDDR